MSIHYLWFRNVTKSQRHRSAVTRMTTWRRSRKLQWRKANRETQDNVQTLPGCPDIHTYIHVIHKA